MKKPTDQYNFDLYLKTPEHQHPEGKLVRGKTITFSNNQYSSSGTSSLAHNYGQRSFKVNNNKFN